MNMRPRKYRHEHFRHWLDSTSAASDYRDFLAMRVAHRVRRGNAPPALRHAWNAGLVDFYGMAA